MPGTTPARTPVRSTRESHAQLFERKRVEALLERVRMRLADDYRRAQKSELFALLEPHLTNQVDAFPRSEITRKLPLSAAAVAMSQHRMRRRDGDIVRGEVAATLDDPLEIEQELRKVMAIISWPSSVGNRSLGKSLLVSRAFRNRSV